MDKLPGKVLPSIDMLSPSVAICISMVDRVSVLEACLLFTFDEDIQISWLHRDHCSDIYFAVYCLSWVVKRLGGFYIEVTSFKLGSGVNVSHYNIF